MSITALKTDHDQMFVLLDELSNMVNLSGVMDEGMRYDCPSRVLTYCTDHFAEEESEMHELGYPQLEKHALEHELMREQFLNGAFMAMCGLDPMAALDGVRNVLIRHIVTWDEAFFQWENRLPLG